MATRVLITGASGLVGSWVLKHWDVPGTTVVPVASTDVDLLAPRAWPELLATARPAVVVHLAWCASGHADYRTSPDNDRWVDSSVQLVEAAAAAGATTWLTGTAVDTSTQAPDAYGRAKSALRSLVSTRIAEGSIGWLRPFYVFDEEWRRPALVDHALTARDRGETVALRTPYQQHDFVHASDVGRAVVTAVRHRLTGEVQIGSGRPRQVSDLVTALGGTWAPETTDAPHGQVHVEDCADTTRLTTHGWSPTRTEEFFAHDR